MTDKFNGEYTKTGTGEITEDDLKLVKKADEAISKLLDGEDVDEAAGGT